MAILAGPPANLHSSGIHRKPAGISGASLRPLILGPFRNPPEFCGTEITILAGSTAKIRFRGIPGIDRIPAEIRGGL
jgi:hypothetical protein